MAQIDAVAPGGPESRLKDLGIHLPAAPTPFGSYVEALQTGNLLFLSGMLPVVDHKPKYLGRLGKELDAEAGRDAAYTAALSALAAARQHLGSLDRVTPPRAGDNDTVMIDAALVRLGALLVSVALQPAMPIAETHKILPGSGIRIRQSLIFDSYGEK